MMRSKTSQQLGSPLPRQTGAPCVARGRDNKSSARFEARSAFTLVELMVTIAVIVTVAAILIPSVKFVLADRKIREAARVADSFVVKAQTDALNGGMGGIWIQRDENSPNTSTRVYQVKSPPPYVGDFLNAVCQITQATRNPGESLNGLDDDGNGFVDDLFVMQVQFDLTTCPSATLLINQGDLIQFDFKGPYFLVTAKPTPNGTTTNPIPVISSSGPVPTLVGTMAQTQFKVVRMPQRSTASYLDLPRGTMIDLAKSGLTVLDLNGNGIADDPQSQGAEFAQPTASPVLLPIVIVFGSNGQIDTVIVNGTPRIPDRSVHLLLANDERDDQAELDPANSAATLNDLANFWLTITRQGTVSTTQVSDLTPVSNPNLPGELLRASRREARRVQTVGGG